MNQTQLNSSIISELIKKTTFALKTNTTYIVLILIFEAVNIAFSILKFVISNIAQTGIVQPQPEYGEYTVIMAIISLLLLILVIPLSWAVVKTVSTYYNNYKLLMPNEYSDKTWVVVVSWFLPFVNLFTPFKGLTQALRGGANAGKDQEILIAQYLFIGSFILTLILSVIDTLAILREMNALKAIFEILSSIVFIYVSYIMFKKQKQLLSIQNQALEAMLAK